MDDDEMDAAQKLAAQIQQKARDAIAPLEREMALMDWPPEFRRILWDAVALEVAKQALRYRHPENPDHG